MWRALCALQLLPICSCLFTEDKTTNGAPTYPTAGAGLWRLIKPESNTLWPGILHEYAAVAADDCLYIHGGTSYATNLLGAPSAQLWKYSLASNEWTRLHPLSPDAPGGRYGHKAVAFNNTIYIFGGYGLHPNSSQPELTTETWAYNITNGTWRQVFVPSGTRQRAGEQWQPDPELPSARHGHVAVVVPQRGQRHGGSWPLMVIFGGLGKEGVLGDMWFMELNTGLWYPYQGEAQTPAPRYGAGSSLIEEKMYVYGGTNGDGSFSDLWCYDFDMDGWFEVKEASNSTKGKVPPPVGRDHAVLVAYEHKLYLMGGMSATGPTLLLDWNMWEWDLHRHWWQPLLVPKESKEGLSMRTKPRPRTSVTPVMIDGAILMYGGLQNGSGYDELWTYQFGKSCNNNCLNGKCDPSTGTCKCQMGYFGESCENKVCLNGCSGNGLCNFTLKTCVCQKGWTSLDCSQRSCPNGCSSRGHCNGTSGVCECPIPFYGESCKYIACTKGCNGRGICNNRTGCCDCEASYHGCDCANATRGRWTQLVLMRKGRGELASTLREEVEAVMVQHSSLGAPMIDVVEMLKHEGWRMPAEQLTITADKLSTPLTTLAPLQGDGWQLPPHAINKMKVEGWGLPREVIESGLESMGVPRSVLELLRQKGQSLSMGQIQEEMTKSGVSPEVMKVASVPKWGFPSFQDLLDLGGPCSRYGHSAVLHGSKMVVFGGEKSELAPNGEHKMEITAELWQLDIGTYQWSLIKSGSELVEATHIPTPRKGHAALLVDDVMVVVGGEAPSGEVLAEHWHLHLSTMKWTMVMMKLDQVGPRLHTSLVAYKTRQNIWRYYLFGGASGKLTAEGFDEDFNDVLMFDVESGAWTVLLSNSDPPPGNASDVPCKRQGHAAAVWDDSNALCMDGCMIMFGGKDKRDNALNDLWWFSFSKKSWLQDAGVSVHTPTRDFHSAAIHRNHLLFYGGVFSKQQRSRQEELLDSSLHLYEVTQRRWMRVYSPPTAPRPAARVHHTTVPADDAFVLFGGLGQGEVYNDVWKFSWGTGCSPVCTKNGQCDMHLGQCICDPPFDGSQCEEGQLQLPSNTHHLMIKAILVLAASTLGGLLGGYTYRSCYKYHVQGYDQLPPHDD